MQTLLDSIRHGGAAQIRNDGSSLLRCTLKNSGYFLGETPSQLVLLVYESRYYFIVCVEIDNAPGMTIYFLPVIRGSSSDKSQRARSFSRRFSSFLPLPLFIALCLLILPYIFHFLVERDG